MVPTAKQYAAFVPRFITSLRIFYALFMQNVVNYSLDGTTRSIKMLYLSILGVMFAMGIGFLVFAYRGFSRAQKEIRARENAVRAMLPLSEGDVWGRNGNSRQTRGVIETEFVF